MQSKRVLVVGLDGATLDLVEPWQEEGFLPNLSKLMKKGSYGKLRSVQPVISSAAWTTFATGTNPGKHGVFDFVYQDGYRLRPATRLQVTQPSLWHILSEQGYRVGIVNVPLTYPPEPVNGFLISGLGTPDFKVFTYPPEFSKHLLQEGYRVNRRIYYPGGAESEFLRDTYEMTEGVTSAALTLMEHEPWDFFMVVYRGTDDVAHGFWHCMDPSHPDYIACADSSFNTAIRDYYQYVDGELGKLMEVAGDDTTVVVVSDHGIGPLLKEVYLNEWLRQRGYLFPRHPPIARRILQRLGVTRNRVSSLLRTVGLGRVERYIKDILGDRIDALPKDAWIDFSEGIDWSQTRAYSFGYQGQIYVNLVGRDPNGIISPGREYTQLLDVLIKDLSEMRDPTDGQKVVDAIYLKEELYNGPHLSKAPDLVLVMRDLSYITRLGYEFGNQPGKCFGEPKIQQTGGHRINGLLIASGPGIRQAGVQSSETWIGDVMPTILHLLGGKIPTSVDGHVLGHWLSAPFAERSVHYFDPSTHVSEDYANLISDEVENEVMARLQDLGYLG
jgi:predicted AlkP superfamily phosphohydrolase/phosphomutase